MELIQFTPTEQELITACLKAEEYRETAWDTYGPDWIYHIPQTVNAFVEHFFGTYLLPWHLAWYYAPRPITDFIGHGARGSSKTVSLAIAGGTFASLNPGQNWMHLSISKDQAQLTYQALLTFGTPRWTERFIAGKPVTSPFPRINLKSWHMLDPGNDIVFRSLKDDMTELLRSHSAAYITVDEAFREISDESTYQDLRGCIRGINRFKFLLLPDHVQDEINTRTREIAMLPIGSKRKQLQLDLEERYVQFGLLRRNYLSLYGNAGPHEWEWQRHDMMQADPEHYLSITTTSYENPWRSQADIEAQERSLADDPDKRNVEMLAMRPTNLGNFFQNVIGPCVEAEAVERAESAQNDGVPGYIVNRHISYGVYHYQLPVDPTHHYVFGADPGSGIAPERNKWAIVGYDISVQPIRMVYFRMGHISPRARGDWTIFWAILREISNTYPVWPGDIFIETTGPQRGMAQLAMPEDVRVTPVAFTTQKIELLNWLRQLLSARKLKWPNIAQLIIEHGNYDLPDKDLNQDIVMANLCAAGALRHYANELDYEVNEPYTAQDDNLHASPSYSRYERPVPRE
jgi:hypothetical protein